MSGSLTNYLKADQVVALLTQGHDLIYYRNTCHTFAGWTINGNVVHGATVNAMLRRGELRELPVRAGWHFSRRAVRP